MATERNLGLAAAAVAGGIGVAALLTLSNRRKRSPAPTDVKLEYFGIHGAGEKVRLALALTGTPFDDERISFDAWGKRKTTAKYGQLPILTVDGTEMYQSDAMLRYVGAHCGDGALYPLSDPAMLFKIDEALGLCDDFARAWQPCVYISMRPTVYGYPADWAADEKSATIKAMRESFVADSLPRLLGYLAGMIEAHGGAFLCGPSPTIADLRLLPQLRYFQLGKADHIDKAVLDAYPPIAAWVERVMALPAVRAWYAVEGH